MNFIKRNIKLIIVFFMGVILASGTIFAYSYYANDISYTKQGSEDEITVATALNDLYGKVPSGTKTIEATGSFDVSQYATAVVQNLYTSTQYNDNYTTGYNAALNSLSVSKTGSNLASGSTINTNIGDLIVVVTMYTSTALGAENVSKNVYGGQLGNANAWCRIYKATSSTVTINVTDNYTFSYIILN